MSDLGEALVSPRKGQGGGGGGGCAINGPYRYVPL